jgi:hypothetical protein
MNGCDLDHRHIGLDKEGEIGFDRTDRIFYCIYINISTLAVVHKESTAIPHLFF